MKISRSGRTGRAWEAAPDSYATVSSDDFDLLVGNTYVDVVAKVNDIVHVIFASRIAVGVEEADWKVGAREDCDADVSYILFWSWLQ